MLERKGQSFAALRYISGLNASRCWSVRRDDGRDALLCEHEDVHQGTGEQALFLVDLAQTDEQLLATGTVVSVTDDEMSGCWSAKGTPVSSVEMRPSQLSQRAGRTELTVELDVRQGRVTEAYLGRCKALERAAEDEAAHPDPAQRPRLLLAGKTEPLLFRFDGSKFVRNGVTTRSGR